jgi:hypothetical protein
MATYIFTKDAEGFSLSVDGQDVGGYVNAKIEYSIDDEKLVIVFNESERYLFYPATDDITIAGEVFEGTPAELWTALTEGAFDEQQGGGGGMTEEEVDTKVADAINALITGAPGALDTLNELAAALGDDANFATTVTNALAAKAPLVDPLFDGQAFFQDGSDPNTFPITVSVGGYGDYGLKMNWRTLQFPGDGGCAIVSGNLLTILPGTRLAIDVSKIADYADNAAAKAGGLTDNMIYRTGDTLKIVHS